MLGPPRMVYSASSLLLPSRMRLSTGFTGFSRILSMARLPAYHTLPSGDKIPTVGLGMHTPAHLPRQPFDLDD